MIPIRPFADSAAATGDLDRGQATKQIISLINTLMEVTSAIEVSSP